MHTKQAVSQQVVELILNNQFRETKHPLYRNNAHKRVCGAVEYHRALTNANNMQYKQNAKCIDACKCRILTQTHE